MIADLSAYQRANPGKTREPADFEPDGTWYSLIAVRDDLGEFNPSSQHVLIGGVDELEEVEVRSIAAREAPIAG